MISVPEDSVTKKACRFLDQRSAVSANLALIVQDLVKSGKMNASNLLQSVLKPRNFSSSPRRSVSSPKRSRKVLNKSCTASENVVPIGGTILKNALPAAPRSCLCSPTNHPGSFRCRFHRAPKAQRSLLPPASPVVTPGTKVSPKRSPSAGGPFMSNTSMKVPSADKVGMMRAVSLPEGSPNCQAPRKFEARPSRLSRVVVAADPEKGIFSSTGKVTTVVSDNKPLAVLNIATELLV